MLGAYAAKAEGTKTRVMARSVFSGQPHELVLNIPYTEFMERFALYAKSREDGGLLIQEAFPNLSNSDREFILNGTTQNEWEEMFSNGNEE